MLPGAPSNRCARSLHNRNGLRRGAARLGAAVVCMDRLLPGGELGSVRRRMGDALVASDDQIQTKSPSNRNPDPATVPKPQKLKTPHDTLQLDFDQNSA